ncbi:MAG: lysophospholipid acyltransferase family protein [Desulfosudaceae bacterium]
MKLLWNYLKVAWLGFWLVAATLILFLPVVTAALCSRTGNLAFSMTKLWAYTILGVTFTRPRLRGKENIEKGHSYIIVSNHQSHFDILSLITCLGIQYRWVIKQELREIPLFGYALDAARNIFIDRSDKQSSIASINRGVDRLPPGAGVLFFAEGTRSADGRLQPFKKGGFIMAIQRQMPILPVTVNGSRKVLPKKSLFFSPGKIEVVVAPPIETTGYTMDDIGELMEKARIVIARNLDPGYPRPGS